VKAMLALDRQSTVPLLFTTRTTTQMHIWSMPGIDELGYDLAVIPIFHGGRVLSESLRARVYLGKDRENNELWVDLDSMPSGFGLVVGPTGMGKTWSVSTLLYRLMRSGIKTLILDPHGEYLRIPGIEPIDITRKFINIFELDGVTDAERIQRLIMNFEVLGIRPESILPDLKAIYANGLYKDFFKAMEFIRARSDDELVGLALDRLMSYLENAEVVPTSELLNNKALLFSSVRSSPDLMSFLMGVVTDHVHTFMMSQSISEHLQQLMVIDEAYFVLNNPLMEYIVRGARKFGLGTIMVTQTITGIAVYFLQNIPLMIVLGGSDAYVNEVAKMLNLTSEDVRWLTTALPPHMAGLTAKALIITGPIRRQGHYRAGAGD
jgi:Predicted ATPase